MDSPRPVDDARVNAFGTLLDAFNHLEHTLTSAMAEDSGLPHSWFEAMIRIAHAPDRRLPMSELGRRIALTSGGITRLVDRLVAAGLVEREPHPDDRRVQLARLTDRGLADLEEAAARHAARVEEHFTGRFDEAELRTLLGFLERLDPHARP